MNKNIMFYYIILGLNQVLRELKIMKKNSYSYDDLITCGNGDLFGPGNAKLPLPPMLMFDRITEINENNGTFNKGSLKAELDIKDDLWFFDCHFKKDPVMPGCLGLDAMWQLVGFYLGWLGNPGRGRALGVNTVKFTGEVLKNVKKAIYEINMKKILTILFLTTSCSYISGPEGLFPPTKNAFLKEKVEEDMILPNDLDTIMIENHYPVEIGETLSNDEKVPKPRQIFASSGNSSVQLRRLGELMWIYVETLPSTSWPITKSYWDTSSFETLNADPLTGEIDISFNENSILKMKKLKMMTMV